MKVLVVSQYAIGAVALAWQIMREGHECEVAIINDDPPTRGGKGIVPVRYALPRLRSWDLVVVDGNGFPELVKKCPVPCVGPTAEAERLELDRAYGMRALEAAGVKTPSWKVFTEPREAREFAAMYGRRLVLKPNGRVAQAWMTCSAARDDNMDLIHIINMIEERDPKSFSKGFILQEFIEGIEVAAGSFFNGHGFAYPIMQTFENKGFAPKPFTGPTTGEMGTYAAYLQSSKLFQETAAKMQNYLTEINYHGDFDVNCILPPGGDPVALEITPRTGFPELCLQMKNVSDTSGSFTQFLHGVARGTAYVYPARKPWVMGVLYTLPPFPYEDYVTTVDLFEGILVEGPVGVTPHLYPLDVYRKEGKLVSGGTGYIAVATGIGDSLSEARSEAYEWLGQVRGKGGYARADIGERFYQEREELERRGYLDGALRHNRGADPAPTMPGSGLRKSFYGVVSGPGP